MNYIESKQTPDLIIQKIKKKSKKTTHTQKTFDAAPCKFICEIKTTLTLIYPIKECTEVIVLFRILPLITQFDIYSLNVKTLP